MELVDRLPARLRAPARQVLAAADVSLVLRPALAGIVTLGVSLVLVGPAAGVPVPLAFDDPETARAMLVGVFSAVVAAGSLVFSGTVVAVQLASGQFSPRLLRNVLADGSIRTILSVFVAAGVHVLVVLSRFDGDAPPDLAVSVGALAGVAVVVIIVYFLHDLVRLLRLESIVAHVVRRTLRTIELVHPRDHEPVDLEVPDDAMSIPARRSGYIQVAAIDALAAAADEAGVHLWLRPRAGDFLTADTVAAWVWPVDGGEVDRDALERLTDRVDDAVAVGVDRTIDGDPAYGLRHLVDIGLRALSPAVNDPTTAEQCIHHGTRLLTALAGRPLVDRWARHGGSIAVVGLADLAAMLELAQSQLLRHGRDDPRIVEALAHQLRDLVQVGIDHDELEVVREHLDRLRSTTDAVDYDRMGREIVDGAIDQVRHAIEGRPDEEESSAG